MKLRKSIPALGLPLGLAALVLSPKPAEAIPAFAAQTGQPCTACHIGAYGPQLTPLGEAFKIGGYTQKGGDGIAAKIPLSVMIQSTFTNTGVDQPQSPPSHYASNNNFSVDQISLFIGGAVGPHTGGFMQITTGNVFQNGTFSFDNNVHLDNTDLRPYTKVFDVGGKDLRLGITVNDNPTVQDPFNSTFAWGFPYISSAMAIGPTADVLLDNQLGGVLGYTAYAWYDDSLYLEAGVYTSMGGWLAGRTGQGLTGTTTSPAPYVRAAYEWQWGNNEAHVGAMLLQADLIPALDTYTAGNAGAGSDRYTDYAIDGGYQYLGDGTNIVTVQGIYTHEDQHLGFSTPAASGGPYSTDYSLDQIRANASYWYKNTYGVTLGGLHTWGSTNPVLYSANANSKPDTTAFTAEADWVPFGKDDSLWAPFLNMKLGLQYTAYTEYNGTTSHASDNNTLIAFAWLIF